MFTKKKKLKNRGAKKSDFFSTSVNYYKILHVFLGILKTSVPTGRVIKYPRECAHLRAQSCHNTRANAHAMQQLCSLGDGYTSRCDFITSDKKIYKKFL